MGFMGKDLMTIFTASDFEKFFRYENGYLFWKNNPRNRKIIGKKAGTRTEYGYLKIALHGKMHFASRVIWIIHHGEIPRGMFIDHIDGNKINNKIENLRLANRSNNMANSKKLYRGKIPSSKYKGVRPYFRKFKSAIRVNKKHIYLGSFVSEKQAAIAYDNAAVKYFGKFAKTNKMIYPKDFL